MARTGSLEVTLEHDPAGRLAVAASMVKMFRGLKTYGKTPEELDDHVDLIIEVCGRFPVEKIKAAILRHLEISSEIPYPADLVQLIEPAPDRAVYIRISQKAPELRTPDDWGYLRRYEAWATKEI